MTAAQIKDALRRRHPALSPGQTMVGEWTCLAEFHDIALLAFSAWSSRQFRRVGYEVKISRRDYRRELLKPYKRVGAVAFCHEFYFAVPVGLLAGFFAGWLDARSGGLSRVYSRNATLEASWANSSCRCDQMRVLTISSS